ncbi:hypothetical protein KDA00_04780 [Candidatus Saccharibacteria bacterium]|nr:hypothetical protein [Candidatus Saccharibacteria bacterium]
MSFLPTGGDVPDFDFERVLEPLEVLSFRDQTIWPAVNRLWRADFLQTAQPGDQIKIRKVVREDDSETNFALQAACIAAPIVDGGNGKIHCATVAIEDKVASHTAELIDAINAEYARRELSCAIPPGEVDYLCAWLNSEYYFDSDDDDLLRKDVELQLIDEDGDVVMDPNLNRQIFVGEGEESDPLQELFEQFGPTLSVDETLRIKLALGILGLMDY